MLRGNEESTATFKAALGKTISSLELKDNALHFVFDDGSKMRLVDDGYLCCESRYMQTDDRLADFVGAKLIGAEVASAPSVADKYWEHEVQFLRVHTDKGTFTMANHNEHNGYYGGFSVVAQPE